MLKPLPNEINGIKIIKDLGTMFPTKKSKNRRRYCEIQCCFCLKTRRILFSNIEKESCFCSVCDNSNKRRQRHKLSNHRIYNIWSGLKSRCFYIHNKRYKDYGGRGITVCSEWKNDFKVFHDWAIANGYSENLSIDRKDNNGNYEPSNCRWVTNFINSQNTRNLISTNTSGFRGVYKRKNNKWRAKITAFRKNIIIGQFDCKKDAAKAYDNYVTINNLEHTKNFS